MFVLAEKIGRFTWLSTYIYGHGHAFGFTEKITKKKNNLQNQQRRMNKNIQEHDPLERHFVQGPEEFIFLNAEHVGEPTNIPMILRL